MNNLKAALETYESMLYRESTREELEAGLNELLKSREFGRLGNCYRPARGLMDDLDDEKEPWP